MRTWMAATILLLFGTGTATAQWGPSTGIEHRDGDVADVQLAIDGRGHALAVWSQHATGSSSSRTDIWHARYTPDGGWGVADRIESLDGSASKPRVAMSADGFAVVAWIQGDTEASLRARIHTPGFGWGEAEIVASGRHVTDLKVVTHGHVAAVAWVEAPADPDDTRVWAARYDDSWRRPTALGGGKAIPAFDATFRDDASLFVAWREGPPSGGDVWVRQHHNLWLAKESLATLARGGPAIAAAGDNIWALWTAGGAPQKATVAVHDGTGWKAPAIIATGAYHEPAPVLASGPGHLLALFGADARQVAGVWTSDIVAMRRTVSWGDAMVLDDNQGPIREARGAMDEDGDATVIWRQGVIGRSDDHLRTVTIAERASPDLLHTIDGGHVAHIALGMDPDGNSLVLWTEGDPDDLWSLGHTGDLGAPRLDIVTPTAATTRDDTTTVSGSTRPTATLKINGVTVPVDPDGGFRYDVMLQPGINPITVAATSIAGVTASETVGVTQIVDASTTPAPVADAPPPDEYPVPGLGAIGVAVALLLVRRSR